MFSKFFIDRPIFATVLSLLLVLAGLSGCLGATPDRARILEARVVRDGVYSFIARNRYRWFGRKDTCRIATPAEKARFLSAPGG